MQHCPACLVLANAAAGMLPPTGIPAGPPCAAATPIQPVPVGLSPHDTALVRLPADRAQVGSAGQGNAVHHSFAKPMRSYIHASCRSAARRALDLGQTEIRQLPSGPYLGGLKTLLLEGHRMTRLPPSLRDAAQLEVKRAPLAVPPLCRLRICPALFLPNLLPACAAAAGAGLGTARAWIMVPL